MPRHWGSLAVVVVCLQMAGLGGCSAPEVSAWQSRCIAAFRGGEEALRECEQSAVTVEDRCRMRLERAALKRQGGLDAYLSALQKLEGAGCGDLEARSEFLGGLALLDAGRTQEGMRQLSGVILGHPDSVAAGEAVKALAQVGNGVAERADVGKVLLGLYERVKERRVAGHLLYYAATETLKGRAKARERALYLLLLVVDYHPESALWDESVWLGADLLRDLGRRSDEARLLEDALLPNRARGMDALLDGFAQKVRLRLAELYARQGRTQEALIQLNWVVNSHSQVGLKDDGLWLAGRIWRMRGDAAGERRALQFLVENCPWSRHEEAARKRLEELGGRK